MLDGKMLFVLCVQRGIEPSALAAVMHSDQWTAHSTAEDKIYYVNTQTKGIVVVYQPN